MRRIFARLDVIVASLSEADCCGLADRPAAAGSADCRSQCPAGTKPKRLIAAKAGRLIGAAVVGVAPAGYGCAVASPPSNETADAFAESVRGNIGARSNYTFDGAGDELISRI